jgi:hypothetical protein
VKSGSIAIAGLIVGAVGLLLAIAVRRRWARPLGALLLAVAVAAQIVALQSRSPSRAEGDGGRFTPAPTGGIPTTIPPSSAPVPTFSVPPPAPHLLDSVHPGTQPILKPTGVNKEFVRLFNPATGPVSLAGWRLSTGSLTFTFPSITLASHHGVVVKSGSGANSSTELHWNQTHYIWPKSGAAVLMNAQGDVVQRCPYHLVGDQTAASC